MNPQPEEQQRCFFCRNKQPLNQWPKEMIQFSKRISWTVELIWLGIATWYFCLYHGGLFMDGCPHGHGRIKWPEGTVYDGNWNHGELHGQGTYIWTSIWKFGWTRLDGSKNSHGFSEVEKYMDLKRKLWSFWKKLGSFFEKKGTPHPWADVESKLVASGFMDHFFFWFLCWEYTPPKKMNMSSEWWLEGYFSFWNGIFLGDMLVFGGVRGCFILFFLCIFPVSRKRGGDLIRWIFYKVGPCQL